MEEGSGGGEAGGVGQANHRRECPNSYKLKLRLVDQTYGIRGKNSISVVDAKSGGDYRKTGEATFTNADADKGKNHKDAHLENNARQSDDQPIVSSDRHGSLHKPKKVKPKVDASTKIRKKKQHMWKVNYSNPKCWTPK